MPFFRAFKREIFGSGDNESEKNRIAAESDSAYGMNEEEIISVLVNLTQQVYLLVERELQLTGFWESIPARNKLKADIQETILKPPYTKLPNLLKKRLHIISRVMEIAEKNNDVIVYSE
jgi:type I restriction enzyme R subunit